MKLEQQVTSLEISKRLKELGVRQESLFYWHGNEGFIIDTGSRLRVPEDMSAFSVGELGELLPSSIRKDEKIFFLDMWKNVEGKPDYFGCRYKADERYEDGEIIWYTNDRIEADARGKMLICLLEKKLIPQP